MPSKPLPKTCWALRWTWFGISPLAPWGPREWPKGIDGQVAWGGSHGGGSNCPQALRQAVDGVEAIQETRALHGF